MSDLIAQYEAQRVEAEALEQQAKDALQKARDTLRTLLTTSGKGPHTIDGKRVIIVERKGTPCLMAEGGPRAKKN